MNESEISVVFKLDGIRELGQLNLALQATEKMGELQKLEEKIEEAHKDLNGIAEDKNRLQKELEDLRAKANPPAQ